MARRLFLERRTYRQARLQDAARLLPVLGLVLFFSPSFIRGEAPASDELLSGWLIYYFSVWFGLIVVAGFLSRALMRTERVDAAAASPDPDREGGT
ncbi:hypothetical protein [Roseicyclus marinus]|uniref:hypothetical protein n=1 Tax=Roseicyclus marinus TaxID=2161673 RepID=UPI00240F1FB2|nr:hypothetical protein [Roseicyclus marinus]MDG3042352.1 hypothetical protein [Roseicyclus marinus]